MLLKILAFRRNGRSTSGCFPKCAIACLACTSSPTICFINAAEEEAPKIANSRAMHSCVLLISRRSRYHSFEAGFGSLRMRWAKFRRMLELLSRKKRLVVSVVPLLYCIAMTVNARLKLSQTAQENLHGQHASTAAAEDDDGTTILSARTMRNVVSGEAEDEGAPSSLALSSARAGTAGEDDEFGGLACWEGSPPPTTAASVSSETDRLRPFESGRGNTGLPPSGITLSRRSSSSSPLSLSSGTITAAPPPFLSADVARSSPTRRRLRIWPF
mmetsp:Transcript_14361/g.40866  ORF Transcript_14361/g.40866 Transcript_14361/m.40866 type:complete len:272 (+) Transcript_14361:147-962(+)